MGRAVPHLHLLYLGFLLFFSFCIFLFFVIFSFICLAFSWFYHNSLPIWVWLTFFVLLYVLQVALATFRPNWTSSGKPRHTGKFPDPNCSVEMLLLQRSTPNWCTLCFSPFYTLPWMNCLSFNWLVFNLACFLDLYFKTICLLIVCF